MAEVVELLRAYWERALAPHWPRVRALLEGDVLHRARQMADGGAERLFADVDPDRQLGRRRAEHRQARASRTSTSRSAACSSSPARSRGRDVVLVDRPEAGSRRSSIPRAGSGRCGRPGARRRPTPSARCSGKVRAAVLMALDRPRSTTDLARALGVSAGGVSQHLSVLREAGLVHGHRVGRSVLYLRSPAGDGLVGAG